MHRHTVFWAVSHFSRNILLPLGEYLSSGVLFVFWIALPFFVFSSFCWCLNLSVWHCWFWSRFYPPHYTSRLQVFSMQLFWSRVPTAYDGSHLLASFVSRVERLLSAFRQFFTERLLVVLRHFYFFVLLFVFCRLLLLLCFGLPFAVLCVAVEFCDFDVSVALTNQTFAFTLFSLSIIKRSLFFFKLKNPSDVLMWYFSCSWSHRFVGFFFPLLCFPTFFPLCFCWWHCQVFLDDFLFFLLDDAGCTRGVLILSGVRCVFCFPCGRGWTDIFLPAGTYNTSWQVAVCVQ